MGNEGPCLSITWQQPFGDVKIMILWKLCQRRVLISNRIRFESWFYQLTIVQIPKPPSTSMSPSTKWNSCLSFRVVVSIGWDNVRDSSQHSDDHTANAQLNFLFPFLPSFWHFVFSKLVTTHFLLDFRCSCHPAKLLLKSSNLFIITFKRLFAKYNDMPTPHCGGMTTMK